MDYKVRWEIEVDAVDPQDAAECALELQRDPKSTATVFEVFDKNGNKSTVDVLDKNVLRKNQPMLRKKPKKGRRQEGSV